MVTVEVKTHCAAAPADPSKLAMLARAVCRHFGLSRAVIGIGIVDDAEMRRLNRKFLRRRGNTDCLSFDLSDEATAGQPRVLDLIVNGELAIREAARRGHAPEAELALYVTHGLLHQLGFDDATTRQASRMHRAEDDILKALGYGSVYDSGARK